MRLFLLHSPRNNKIPAIELSKQRFRCTMIHFNMFTYGNVNEFSGIFLFQSSVFLPFAWQIARNSFTQLHASFFRHIFLFRSCLFSFYKWKKVFSLLPVTCQSTWIFFLHVEKHLSDFLTFHLFLRTQRNQQNMNRKKMDYKLLLYDFIDVQSVVFLFFSKKHL